MIGKIIGAFVGDKIAKQTRGVNGATGAALGVAATALVRRMSLPAMIVVGAGGYLAKKFIDKQEAEKTANETVANRPPATSTAPAIA